MMQRWTILLAAGLLMAAAGGVVAAAPILRAALDDDAVAERAPTPELEADRRAVLGGLHRSVEGLTHRAEQLELLSDLLAAAAAEPAHGPATPASYGIPQSAK